MRVWNTYGKCEAWALCNRKRRDAPWKSTFEHGTKYLVIPQEAMREFFAAALMTRSRTRAQPPKATDQEASAPKVPEMTGPFSCPFPTSSPASAWMR